MQLPERFATLPEYACPRLRRALDDVPCGEAAALGLRRRAGLRVRRGACLGRDAGAGNPGRGYVRVGPVAGLEGVARRLGAIRDRPGALRATERV